MSKTIDAAAFKADCLEIIDQVAADRHPVVVTKDGQPVAVVSPVPDEADGPLVVGAMRGSVLRYDDPFGPAAAPADWSALP